MSNENLAYTKLLAEVALRGDEDALKLALGLCGAAPCDACGYVKTHCKCATNPVPIEPSSDFVTAWLVELFYEATGNSTGYYHTGGVNPDRSSRIGRNPYFAKRYATKAEAELELNELSTRQGVWKAVEHGFVTIPTVPDSSVASRGEFSAMTKLIGQIGRSTSNGEALGYITEYRREVIRLDRERCAKIILENQSKGV